MTWLLLEDDICQQLLALQQGQLAKLSIEDRDICVGKTDQGWFGINNRCPHAGAQLHFGHCNKKGVVSCPLHQYKFDLTTGRSVDGNNYQLTRYAFKLEDNKMYLGIR